MKMFLTILCLFVASIFCSGVDSTISRVKNATTPFEYMRELYYESKEEGVHPPTLTDVWCFKDRDVFKGTFRKNQQTSHQCSTPTHYIFQWPLLAEALSLKQLSLLRIYLRAYLNVDQRYIHDSDETIQVSLTMTLYKEDESTDDAGKSNHEIGSSTVLQEVILDGLTDQWIEMNLIEAGREMWPVIKDSTHVRITVQTNMECNDSLGSPPFIFINPAEIPLENTEERERLIATSEPFLLVMAGDDRLSIYHRKPQETVSDETNRNKRHNTEDECHKEDYLITFSEIQINNVILPTSLNIGKCSGVCSEDYLRHDTDLGTNHARTMSTIRTIQEYQPELGDIVAPSGPADIPCCVPRVFNQNTALYIQGDDGTLSVHKYNDLVIERCGCL